MLEVLITLAIIAGLIFFSYKYNFMGVGQKASNVQQGINVLKNGRDITNQLNQSGAPEQGIIDKLSK